MQAYIYILVILSKQDSGKKMQENTNTHTDNGLLKNALPEVVFCSDASPQLQALSSIFDDVLHSEIFLGRLTS